MPDPNTIDETLAALDGLEDAATEEVTAPPAPEDAPAAVVVDEADPVIAAARAAAAEAEAGVGENPKPPLSNREKARAKAKDKARTPLEVAENAVRRNEEALAKAKKSLAALQKRVDNPQRRPRDIASLNRRNREYTQQEAEDRASFRDFIAKHGLGERKRPMPPRHISKQE